MSRARKISSDLRHVATLAGTTAAVVVATQDSGPQKFHQVF